MQYAKRVFPLFAVVLFFSLVLPSIASAAGDPVAGMTLYNMPYSGLSCGTSGCHGGFTGANNPNKIKNGANNPTIIQSAINGNTGGMGVFKSAFTATDLANIAAYIANPSGASGAPAVSLAPTSLAFGSQAINTAITQSVTLTNSGTAALSVTGITAPSGYTQSNNCSSVAAGASCVINVTFTPTAVYSYSGNLTITDNAAGSPHGVAVSGSGVGVAQASVAPAGLTFSQTVSTISMAKAVALPP
jgi:mono/diheme cytochrome c family protein